MPGVGGSGWKGRARPPHPLPWGPPAFQTHWKCIFLCKGNHVFSCKVGTAGEQPARVYTLWLAPALLQGPIGSLAPLTLGGSASARPSAPRELPGSPPDPLPPPLSSRPSPPPLHRAPPLPPPGAAGSESSQRLPGRQADTGQIGIGERKGGKSCTTAR